jgi:hypothetical protein
VQMQLSKKSGALTTENMAILVSSYHRNFHEYSKGRVRTTQRVPAKVWKNVYLVFIERTRDAARIDGVQLDISALPSERTLQAALRAGLDPDTGVSDVRNATNVAPQDEDVLKRLKLSDGHARRNMVGFRDSLLAAGSLPSFGSTERQRRHLPTSDTRVEEPVAELMPPRIEHLEEQTPTESANSGDDTASVTPSSRKRTMQELQGTVASCIKSISTSMLESQVTFKAHLEVSQEGLEMKKAEHKLDMTRKQLDEAKFLLDCGVKSTEEFQEKARKIVNT